MEMMQSGGMRLRSYQQEMLEASLQRNTIVVMDTGSGKTIVAASRILAELERSVTGKAIWLLVPNVALAQQHYGRLSDLLPAYHVLLLTGNDGVEKCNANAYTCASRWKFLTDNLLPGSEQKLWDLLLKGVSLVICTPAVLLDALTHGFIKIEEIPLLVFDEGRLHGIFPLVLSFVADRSFQLIGAPRIVP
jgi:ERCC4-related helicase